MILLDTCTLLWLATDQNKLSMKAKSTLQDSKGFIYSSAISAFEIAIKVKKKKITMQMDAFQWYKECVRLHGIKEISLNAEIFVESVALPDIHQDPCDRMIIATAKLHKLSILTVDELIKQYKTAKTIW